MREPGFSTPDRGDLFRHKRLEGSRFAQPADVGDLLIAKLSEGRQGKCRPPSRSAIQGNGAGFVRHSLPDPIRDDVARDMHRVFGMPGLVFVRGPDIDPYRRRRGGAGTGIRRGTASREEQAGQKTKNHAGGFHILGKILGAGMTSNDEKAGGAEATNPGRAGALVDPEASARLRRMFLDGFRIGDIAEPLASLDASADAGEAQVWMEARRYRVVGVRVDGLVAGFVEARSLDGGTLGASMQAFENDQVLPDTAGLSQALPALDAHGRVFVKALGRVAGIATRTDMEKPPVRMWLFGMITILEMNFHRAIVRLFPDDTWTGRISEGRLEKAITLREERIRRGTDCDLLDCLQLTDKVTILLRDEAARKVMGFASMREGLEALKGLERLRNHLAHSQDIVQHSWPEIVALGENVDTLIEARVLSRLLDA